MEPKSGQKPVNVLAAYLSSWIRENSDEALPFDSFETLRSRRIAQKNVERWIFNCNYLYNRVGDILYDDGLLPETKDECERLIASIDTSFKMISDTTPLDLRSKPAEAIKYELSKDWPPFCENSRNTLPRFEQAFQTFEKEQPALFRNYPDKLQLLKHDLEDEATYYEELSSRIEPGSRSLATTCRVLLPIWCAKEINPIVTLLIWNDESAITELAGLLRDAFLQQQPSQEESISSWHAATMQAQTAYLNEFDDDCDLTMLSIREIGALLDTRGFSLDQDETPRELPRWLLGKTRLIWNIVICSILGPAEAVGGAGARQTPTLSAKLVPYSHSSNNSLEGEVLLRRRYHNGRVETVDRLLLDSVCSPGLWKVIGSHYDPNAPLPNSRFRNQYAHLGASYISSETFDVSGNPVEGVGDSRFHIELSIEIDEHGRGRFVARDLGSKNGSCILRTSKSGLACYAFPGRRHTTNETWANRMGINVEDIHMVHEVSLERGDIIQLASSSFELI